MLKLKLSQKLHVIRMVKSGITHQAAANKFGLELPDAQTILRSQAQLEKNQRNREQSKKSGTR